MPPTPPPDIDLEAWRDSFASIEGWRADTLFITHFGPYAPVARASGRAARSPGVDRADW